MVANRKGFSVRIAGHGVIQCNRRNYGNNYQKRSNKKRKFLGGELQCKCNFHIKIKANKFFIDVKKKHRPDWNSDDCFVTIVDGILRHSGDCKPSTQQHIFTKCRSGKYVEDISSMALYTLCNSANRNGKGVNSIVSGMFHFYTGQFTFAWVNVNRITFVMVYVMRWM